MKDILIYNTTRPAQPPQRAGYCASFLCRLRGLMFRKSLPAHWGLLLVQDRDSRMDSSIHMLFVGMDLAVIWINNSGQVVDLVLARQWRPAYFPRHPARYILELAPGCLGDYQIGDQLRFEEVSLD